MNQETGGAGNPVKAIHFLATLCPPARFGNVLHGGRQEDELFRRLGAFLVAVDVVGGGHGL